jgi:hypothetical protein
LTFEEALRLFLPPGETGDEIHEMLLELRREGLTRIEEDWKLVFTELAEDETHWNAWFNKHE